MCFRLQMNRVGYKLPNYSVSSCQMCAIMLRTSYIKDNGIILSHSPNRMVCVFQNGGNLSLSLSLSSSLSHTHTHTHTPTHTPHPPLSLSLAQFLSLDFSPGAENRVAVGKPQSKEGTHLRAVTPQPGVQYYVGS